MGEDIPAILWSVLNVPDVKSANATGFLKDAI